jgi:hypothetical protein
MYLPRDAMIEFLERVLDVPLVAPEQIHDLDLRAIVDLIMHLDNTLTKMVV